MEDWKVTVDCKETVGILSTDMSKAFDSLHSALMLNKLKGYGFTEDALSLVRSYFEDHQCRIKVGPIKVKRVERRQEGLPSRFLVWAASLEHFSKRLVL